MKENVHQDRFDASGPLAEAVRRARDGLVALQQPDGRWEGLLTPNLYPTVATLTVRLLADEPLDEAALDWLSSQQLPDGRFPLDPQRIPSDEATRLVRVYLKAAAADDATGRTREMLTRIPLADWGHWIVQLFGAVLGQREWSALAPSRSAAGLGLFLARLAPILPRGVFQRIRPPERFAPPPGLFRTAAFRRLFLAEQYTLAPVFYLIELHGRGKTPLLNELLEWILARQDAAGSWFSVNFITALTTVALHFAQRATPRPRLDRCYAAARDWLEQTRHPSGGYREAIDLNVWDTALAALALLQAGMAPWSDPIRQAADWLVGVQNVDGGWAFHGLRGDALPSDADDTALATRLLLETGLHPSAAERGIAWLARRQAADGSWSTYRPGVGDVGCVSVSARALEVMAQAGESRRVRRGLRWMVRAQRSDGSWDDLWLARGTYGTSCALVALARLGASSSRAVRRGLEWLQNRQNPDGGWGETQQGQRAPSTAEQTAFAVRALRAWNRGAQGGVEWLLSRQRPDGGWEPAPIGIYWEVIGGYANPINAWVFPLLALTEEPCR